MTKAVLAFIFFFLVYSIRTEAQTVGDLQPQGANITWYNAPTGGQVVLKTTPLVNGTHYYASQIVNGCESTSRLDVTATVNPLPQGSLSANGPFCSSGAGMLTWTKTAGTGPYTVIYHDGTANRTAANVTSGTPFAVYSTPVTTTTTYTLVSVQDANCTRSSGFTGNSATITIQTCQTDFSYTGSMQTYTAPANGSYILEVWGAQGGLAGSYSGGLGGYATGTLTLTAGQTISVYVGQAGLGPGGGAAWNGGGYGTCCGAGGGGGTDLRIGGTALTDRVIVAGAGGGGSSDTPIGNGGAGGGSSGGYGTVGAPGTQTTGYALGVGESNGTDAAGGGGGYYGGYNGGIGTGGSGGGGSAYVGGVTGGTMIAGDATMPNPSGGTMTGRSGSGFARIKPATP